MECPICAAKGRPECIGGAHRNSMVEDGAISVKSQPSQKEQCADCGEWFEWTDACGRCSWCDAKQCTTPDCKICAKIADTPKPSQKDGVTDREWFGKRNDADWINALPEYQRRYIHDLETRCDPAGDIQTLRSTTEQRDALLRQVQEMKEKMKLPNNGFVSIEEASSIPQKEDGFEEWWNSESQYELARSLEGEDDCDECCQAYAAAAWQAARTLPEMPKPLVSDGAAMIAEERKRQVAQECWTPEHDDEHVGGELAFSGEIYARQAAFQVKYGGLGIIGLPNDWPWDANWWKPSPDPIRNLVKAGALIAAEIDRLQRVARKVGK